MGKEILTYDDLLQIVELIKSAEAFSEFHLKVGDIESTCARRRRIFIRRAACCACQFASCGGRSHFRCGIGCLFRISPAIEAERRDESARRR